MNLYLYDRLRDHATQLLIDTAMVRHDAITLIQPKPSIPADLAFPVFAVAKAANAGNPAEYARKIAAAVVLPPDSWFESVGALAGFVNFSVAPGRFADGVVEEVLRLGADFGRDTTVGNGEKTVVEFSSPNIAKKMHVGHLRTTVIGNAIRNILGALGYDVVADNHLGDWGTQFGYLLAAFDTDGFPADMQTDPINALVRIYSDFYGRSEADPSLKDKARFWFRRLEQGDTWARDTWKMIVDISLAEFNRTYARLDIRFDTTHGESYFEPMLEDILVDALAKGVAVIEPGGAVVVEFGDLLPSCLLRKTDGATLYQTRDVATCIYRWNEFRPTRNVYVVGAEQTLHFQQVFEIVRRLGYPDIADRSVHISFGMLTKATGEKFSARKGENIYLEEVLDEATARARAKVLEQVAAGRSEVSGETEIAATAEMIGLGSVIYADLFQGPERNIQFDWDKMLSNEGNTAPYIQYTYARCRSILREATGTYSGASGNPALLVAVEEQAVLKQLARMPHAVREAGEKFLPATVAEWTYTLAREFARFYHECPVLKAPTQERRAARLILVEAVAIGLRNGTALLGIKVPERM